MSEWHPRETAPRLGTDHYIMVWDKKYDRAEIVRVMSDGSFWWGDWDFEVDADFWRPLPERPA